MHAVETLLCRTINHRVKGYKEKAASPMKSRSLRLALLGWRHRSSSLIPAFWRSNSFIEVGTFILVRFLAFFLSAPRAHVIIFTEDAVGWEFLSACRLLLMPNFLLINNHLLFSSGKLIIVLGRYLKVYKEPQLWYCTAIYIWEALYKRCYPFTSKFIKWYLQVISLLFCWKGREKIRWFNFLSCNPSNQKEET